MKFSSYHNRSYHNRFPKVKIKENYERKNEYNLTIIKCVEANS